MSQQTVGEMGLRMFNDAKAASAWARWTDCFLEWDFFCLDAAWLNVAVVRAVALLSATDSENVAIFFSCIAERARDMVGQLVGIRKRSETVIECRSFHQQKQKANKTNNHNTNPTHTKPASENSQKR